ncbi:UDP-D-galactose:(glucosyl)lipopolysaccharide-1,6-D-galactosyltransferase [Rosistilla ulvae]|uniref:UDP-D-galactose:(Glucosyl)lipopolysaccharide-1, 6-D-galactosyltransferase n=1 Tax=Rosistilla ulvae TaxID=1930277 RepID=A0A517M206_9BACT|nr:glycosyltransferase family 4 protein [Rosistilla ulvae]QDS88911.1 UDP-D-galactose:(glucosyl)lipopolysaccharide-1,6-D-galactosyltransferase [Rosistilla ulvae]
MGLKSKYRQWRVARADNDRAKSMQGRQSVALGFAWRAANIGGVRRHLECIEKYSQHAVALYPSTPSHDFLKTRDERSQYHADLGDPLIDRHSLFHSHVDPDFIAIAQRAQQAGKAWVHTYHALYFAEDYGGKLKAWQEKTNHALLNHAAKADVRICVSPWLAGYLLDQHRIETVVIPNAVDVSFCDGIRAKTQDGARINTVVFVGSNDEVKNPSAFIEVARRLPELQFSMVGTGLTRGNFEERYCVEVPLNVQPLGPLSHEATLELLSRCSTLVMTSHREGLPTVLLEAMAMEKPCVAPRSYGCADVIGSEEFGFLYEPNNLEDLKCKIGQSVKLGRMPRARRRVVDSFSWPVVAKQLDDIYSGLLSSSTRF